MDLSGVELVLALGIVLLLVLALVLGRRVAGLRDRVERLERGGHPQTSLQACSPASPGISGLPADVEHEVRGLVDSGKKIVAIKLVRECTRLGLRDAKELVDRL